jgi:raffinose/stachyose/melibiose transport system permease protein
VKLLPKDNCLQTAIRWLGSAAVQVFLVALLVITGYPLLYMFFMSLKGSDAIFDRPWLPPLNPDWQNYAEAWVVGHVGTYFINSVIVTASSVLLMTSFSVLAGYVFGRIKFRGDKLLFMTVVSAMTLPIQSILIPVFILVKRLGWLNTYIGLIFPYVGFGIALGVFILQGFFASLPKELEDAARIDGCSEFGIFFRVMLPLAWPPIGSMAVFNFNWVWSEFLWSVTTTSDDSVKTLPSGLFALQGRWVTEWGPLMAGLTMIVIPMLIIYFLFQRQFVRGLTAGAVKG